MQLKTARQKGSSLVELLLVITTIGFIVVLIASLPNSLNLISKAKRISIAREIATKEIESQRSYAYINLTEGETQISDSRLSLLPGGSGKTEIEACSLDNICLNDEEAKIVTVIVAWKENGEDQVVSLKTLIGEGGLVN